MNIRTKIIARNLIFGLITILLGPSTFARTLRATADKLGQEASQIGFALGIFGLVIGAIYLMLGKQDASMKITGTLFGLLIIAVAKTAVTFIKSVA